MKTKSVLRRILAAAMTAALLAGCADSETEETTAAKEESVEVETGAEATETGAAASGTTGLDLSCEFTYLIDANVESYFYDEYEKNPVYLYWSSLTWDAYGEGNQKQISIDFTAPPSSGASEYVNTLLATGEYPDIMSLSYSSEKANQLYEEGIALDLTEYVTTYMPNYMAWMSANPEYADMMYNNVDGEKRILQLYGFSDTTGERGNGFLYRRDWIVKYGTNPTSGQAFTGGYDEEGNWSDDVVFPSGSTFPVYISDWEWMFEIFETALQEQNVEDGYVFQLPNAGYWATGEMATGFGGIGTNWYLDEEGNCRFGGNSDGMRAYLECVNTWYENGWLDEFFMEQPEAIFWSVDTASVFSGKVGMWYGLKGVVGNQIDTSGGDPASPACGAFAAAAPSPINDKYGDSSVQGKDPRCFFGASLLGNPTIITSKCRDKDIPTLLTAIDSLYDREGGILRSYGMNAEQAAVDTGSTFYAEQGYENGFYSVEERNGETWIVTPAEDTLETGLRNAMIMERVMGMSIYDHVDQGFSENLQEALNIWVTYDNTGYLNSAVTGQLTTEQSENQSIVNANITNYMSQMVPKFITGELDIADDSAWDTYCRGIDEFDPYSYADAVNEVLGKQAAR